MQTNDENTSDIRLIKIMKDSPSSSYGIGLIHNKAQMCHTLTITKTSDGVPSSK
jgi:hypothetical protein